MSELDLPKRLARYLSTDPSDKDWADSQIADMLGRHQLEIRRLALTDADTLALGDETSFPAEEKSADTRYDWFVTHYGWSCWELDAMNPNALRTRVADAIRAEVNPVRWARYVEAERVERESIIATTQAWQSTLEPDLK